MVSWFTSVILPISLADSFYSHLFSTKILKHSFWLYLAAFILLLIGGTVVNARCWIWYAHFNQIPRGMNSAKWSFMLLLTFMLISCFRKLCRADNKALWSEYPSSYWWIHSRVRFTTSPINGAKNITFNLQFMRR